jgi:hypothetical protein
VISDRARTLAYSRLMTVWLVAEDRVQIVRADSVITFTAVPVKPTGIEHADPLARMPSYDRIRIVAATASARNTDASPWTALITFKANGKGAVKVLAELAETIAEAEQSSSHGASAGARFCISTARCRAWTTTLCIARSGTSRKNCRSRTGRPVAVTSKTRFPDAWVGAPFLQALCSAVARSVLERVSSEVLVPALLGMAGR